MQQQQQHQRRGSGAGAAEPSLERVLGTTARAHGQAAWSPSREEFVAVAGSLAVATGVRQDRQLRHYRSPGNRPLACVAYSPCGRFVAAGEAGAAPEVLVWEASDARLAARLPGHAAGVTALAFSGDGLLASASGGDAPEVRLWRWQDKAPLARLDAPGGRAPLSLDFSDDGTFFVSAGAAGVHAWPVEARGAPAGAAGDDAALPRDGIRPVPASVAADFRGLPVAAAVCGRGAHSGSVYAVSQAGVLWQLKPARRAAAAPAPASCAWELDKWVDLRLGVASGLAHRAGSLLVGGSDGRVRLCSADNLAHVATLPRPCPLPGRAANLARSGTSKKELRRTVEGVAGAYPAAAAVCLGGDDARRALCVYADRSVIVWDLRGAKAATVARSYQYHGAGVWDLDTAAGAAAPPYGRAGDAPSPAAPLPPGTLVSCSDDGTVRFWNLDHPPAAPPARSPSASPAGSPVPTGAGAAASQPRFVNAFSRTLLRVIHASGRASDSGAAAAKADDAASPRSPPAVLPPASLRCVRLVGGSLRSPDALAVAVGDGDGNLRVYNLDTFEETCFIEAHNSEVLGLDWWAGGGGGGDDAGADADDPLLVTCGRDRMVHLFRMRRDELAAEPVLSLHEHSGAVTAARFIVRPADRVPAGAGGDAAAAAAATATAGLVSCGADSTLVFREVAPGGVSAKVTAIGQMKRGTLHGLALHPTGRFAVTCGADRRLHIWNARGKRTRAYKDEGSGEFVRVALDPAGIYAAASSSGDRRVRLFDWFSGKCLAALDGHAEVVTSVRFSADCRRLYTASADGCILAWRLPDGMTRAMLERLGELYPHAEERPGDAAAAAAALEPLTLSVGPADDIALALRKDPPAAPAQERREGDAVAPKELLSLLGANRKRSPKKAVRTTAATASVVAAPARASRKGNKDKDKDKDKKKKKTKKTKKDKKKTADGGGGGDDDNGGGDGDGSDDKQEDASASPPKKKGSPVAARITASGGAGLPAWAVTLKKDEAASLTAAAAAAAAAAEAEAEAEDGAGDAKEAAAPSSDESGKPASKWASRVPSKGVPLFAPAVASPPPTAALASSLEDDDTVLLSSMSDEEVEEDVAGGDGDDNGSPAEAAGAGAAAGRPRTGTLTADELMDELYAGRELAPGDALVAALAAEDLDALENAEEEEEDDDDDDDFLVEASGDGAIDSFVRRHFRSLAEPAGSDGGDDIVRRSVTSSFLRDKKQAKGGLVASPRTQAEQALIQRQKSAQAEVTDLRDRMRAMGILDDDGTDGGGAAAAHGGTAAAGAAHRSALDQLRQSVARSLTLFAEVQKQAAAASARARGGKEKEKEEEDEEEGEDLANMYRAELGTMRDALDTAVADGCEAGLETLRRGGRPLGTARRPALEATVEVRESLDHYSDLLVGLVEKKLAEALRSREEPERD